MAYIFGKETLESGSFPYSFASIETPWGDATASIDATSKIGGTNSIMFANTGEGSAVAAGNLGADYTTIFLQFRGLVPTGFAFGASGYCGLFDIWDGDGMTQEIFGNIEDWGTVRLTINGLTFGYHDTGISLPVNSVFRLEVMAVKHATTGRVKVWLNNTTEGSPDYDSGDVNTGATHMDWFRFGKTYVPESMSPFYQDDFIMDSTFIGSGVELVLKDVIQEGIIPFAR